MTAKLNITNIYHSIKQIIHQVGSIKPEQYCIQYQVSCRVTLTNLIKYSI